VTTVNLVAFENGVGNSRDIVLLADALRALGCSVALTVPSKHARRRRRLPPVRAFCAGRLWLSRRRQALGRPARFDLTVMLEHVWPEQLHVARRNVIVPNPEFFDRHDRSLLGSFDAVWAKTRNTYEIFTRLGAPALLTGFDSVDRRLDGAMPTPTFLHVAGKSRMKGTARLLALWQQHPEWPTLTVVQSLGHGAAPARAANIVLETRYLDDGALRALQNGNAIHLCTSETEGWGHYIGEAQSTGAVVIATDAPPMNELVTSERGLLVRAAPSGQQHLARTYRFETDALAAAVERALDLGEHGRRQLGAAARDWFWDNKRSFPARLASALAQR
jgi:glycosyltransferase involved in cell wall biosynthesis